MNNSIWIAPGWEDYFREMDQKIQKELDNPDSFWKRQEREDQERSDAYQIANPELRKYFKKWKEAKTELAKHRWSQRIAVLGFRIERYFGSHRLELISHKRMDFGKGPENVAPFLYGEGAK